MLLRVAGELVVLLPVNGGFAWVTVEAAGVADQCAAPSAPNLHRPMLSGNTKLSCLSSPLSWPSQTDAASCVCRPSIGIGELNSCSNPPVSKLAITPLKSQTRLRGLGVDKYHRMNDFCGTCSRRRSDGLRIHAKHLLSAANAI
jgi:hypothetical protein